MVERLIIDTDPGVDDAMAILYAQLDPEIELLGLTSIFGNVTIDIATRNALRLIEMTGGGVLVAQGARAPLQLSPREVASEVHGVEGFGTIPPEQPKTNSDERPAHIFITDLINKFPGEVTLCPVGPLTNIALAVQHDLSIIQKLKGVTVMGGSLDEGGNVTPYAEANIWQDPHAAEIVFSSGMPITMIGLDVTHKIICQPEDFTDLAKDVPRLGGFLNEAAQFYIDFHIKANGFNGCHMHDPAAVISVVKPELFNIEETPVDVILNGERIGETVRSDKDGQPAIKVAMAVRADAVKEQFFNVLNMGD